MREFWVEEIKRSKGVEENSGFSESQISNLKSQNEERISNVENQNLQQTAIEFQISDSKLDNESMFENIGLQHFSEDKKELITENSLPNPQTPTNLKARFFRATLNKKPQIWKAVFPKLNNLIFQI